MKISEKKDKYIVWFHLYAGLRIDKCIATESRIDDAGADAGRWGGDIGSYRLMGVEFCLGQLKSLEMDIGDDCTTLEMYSVPLNCIPKNG